MVQQFMLHIVLNKDTVIHSKSFCPLFTYACVHGLTHMYIAMNQYLILLKLGYVRVNCHMKLSNEPLPGSDRTVVVSRLGP